MRRKVYKKGTIEEIYFNFALRHEEKWTKRELENTNSPVEREKLQKRLDRIHVAQAKEGHSITMVQTFINSDSFDILDFIEKFQKEHAPQQTKRKQMPGTIKNILAIIRKNFRI